MTEIKTERLLLRPMRASDLDGLFAVFSDARAMQYWSKPPMTDPAPNPRRVTTARVSVREKAASAIDRQSARATWPAGL